MTETGLVETDRTETRYSTNAASGRAPLEFHGLVDYNLRHAPDAIVMGQMRVLGHLDQVSALDRSRQPSCVRCARPAGSRVGWARRKPGYGRPASASEARLWSPASVRCFRVTRPAGLNQGRELVAEGNAEKAQWGKTGGHESQNLASSRMKFGDHSDGIRRYWPNRGPFWNRPFGVRT